MNLQFIRHDGRILGIALFFSGKISLLGTQEVSGFSIAANPAPPAPAVEPWRFCDKCAAKALVFCKDHSVYLCEFCLALHNNRPQFCSYLSMTAATELMARDRKWEAHT
ncbi:MAG: hypothetical protein ACRD20_02465 [Terriglobales bacterium]